MKRVYLDYAATTPVDKRVQAAMAPYFLEKFGNPGSLHFFGQEAMAAVDFSREKIAKSIGADFREIIFTGSATEANNLVLRGVIRAFSNNFSKPRIIISTIEHESIRETANDLQNEGIEIIYLPVNREGLVDLKKLKDSLNERTILVSIMYANNEIGVLQPIAEISKIIKSFRGKNIFPFFHTDAVQAFQFFNCNAEELGADFITLSAHKIYGPKGIGALYARKFKNLKAIITGGGQEFGLRSGTENVTGIVGFAEAVEITDKLRKKEVKRISELKNYFWPELKKLFPDAEINGAADKTLPNILNIYFPGHSVEDLLIKFDTAGIAVSAGSACSVRSAKPSHVLKALGLSQERIRGSVRFSFGRFTTPKELREALKRMKKILN